MEYHVLKNNGNVEFKQKFKANKQLPDKHNTKSFENILQTQLKICCFFLNPSKDTLQLYQKHDQVRITQLLKILWIMSQNSTSRILERSSNKCREQMEEHKKVWVSAHGLGVPYFHLRIAIKPKYYFDEELSKS